MVQAAVQIAALAYQAIATEQQRGAASRGRKQALAAQNEAQAAAVAEAKRAEQADNQAAQKTPDLSVLLSDSLLPKRPKPGSIDINRLTLGRPGQLGLTA